MDLNLQSDEAIILRTEGVSHGGIMATYSDELVLTNRNIYHIKKGLFGGAKQITRFSVNDLKIYDDIAQAKLGKQQNGSVRLELYFKSGEEYYGFQSKNEVIKWVNAINKLLTGVEMQAVDAGKRSIPGAEAVAETLKGTFDTFKGVFGMKTKSEIDKLKVSGKCSSCGAVIVGIKGTSAKCEYCGSYTDF